MFSWRLCSFSATKLNNWIVIASFFFASTCFEPWTGRISGQAYKLYDALLMKNRFIGSVRCCSPRRSFQYYLRLGGCTQSISGVTFYKGGYLFVYNCFVVNYYYIYSFSFFFFCFRDHRFVIHVLITQFYGTLMQ